jgi:hypothetical protein
MARAVKGFNYSHMAALASVRGSDVERMTPRARKAYLQRHLHLVETQIHILAAQLGFDEDDLTREGEWTDSPLDEERWASLINLDYLLATRDALKETLANF